MDVLFTTDGLISLFTLTIMEIILGIDNIIFISIVADKLPESQQKRARSLGLIMALLFRVALLLMINWIVQLTDPVIMLSDVSNEAGAFPFHLSWRDIILIAGGIFLMVKTILEMHHKLEGVDDSQKKSWRQ